MDSPVPSTFCKTGSTTGANLGRTSRTVRPRWSLTGTSVHFGQRVIDLNEAQIRIQKNQSRRCAGEKGVQPPVRASTFRPSVSSCARPDRWLSRQGTLHRRIPARANPVFKQIIRGPAFHSLNGDILTNRPRNKNERNLKPLARKSSAARRPLNCGIE